MIAPLELLSLVVKLGTVTEVTLTPFCRSQPAPRPRYQPSLAIAGVESASAATPAKAIIRIFIFSLA